MQLSLNITLSEWWYIYDWVHYSFCKCWNHRFVPFKSKIFPNVLTTGQSINFPHWCRKTRSWYRGWSYCIKLCCCKTVIYSHWCTKRHCLNPSKSNSACAGIILKKIMMKLTCLLANIGRHFIFWKWNIMSSYKLTPGRISWPIKKAMRIL